MIITGKGRRGLEAEGKMARSRQCGIGEGEGREERRGEARRPAHRTRRNAHLCRLGRTGLHAWIKELGQSMKKRKIKAVWDGPREGRKAEMEEYLKEKKKDQQRDWEKNDDMGKDEIKGKL